MKRSVPAVLLAAAFLSACGNLSVPARDINTPPARSTATTPVAAPTPADTSTSVNAFVAASAVTVGPGDTVYALSRRHRVPAPAIIRANGLRPPYILQVGQRIVLPRGRQYRIESGDTLYAIAQRYDVGVYELARLNAIEPPYTIRSGDIVVIPGTEPVKARTIPRPAPTPQPAAEAAPVTAASPPTPATPRVSAPSPAPSRVSTEGDIALVPPRKPPPPVSAPPARSARGFVWPARGRVISRFGNKSGGLRNDGINIRAERGTPVTAAENGVVAYAGNEIRGFGNLLLIKHADGYVTAYAHTDRLLVQRGQKVTRGQKIATVGSTGSVAEPQLHFEIRKGRRPRDPMGYLAKAG